eukprot:TRINITY_DN13015_c0_g1_i1.p1 TRINITY_DN13015_c0_g1~~TRINITY_DN13015_c0_g1_i1.p1  ORF type:complete len:424 (+),score=90.72 TRINITY_DN13015_c0_g1_i1:149-1420(+)
MQGGARLGAAAVTGHEARSPARETSGGGTATTDGRGGRGAGVEQPARGRERRGGWERGWDDETESSSSDSSSRTRLAGRVFHEWEAGRKVGSGSFGQCYAAADMRTGKRVCLKVEDTADRSELDREYEYLLLLGHGVDDDCMVTPRAFDYVTCGRKEVLVQELLGPSINSLYLKCGERLSQHSVLMLAPQVIDCIRHVHRCGLVHRDIKPHNFLMGRGDRAHKVYVIDFGLSKRWRRDDGSHIPFALGKHLTGTVRYVSTNVHRGYEQSRRDDLLSIGHMLLYLVKGKLPWQGLQNKKRRHEAVHQVKEETSLKDMCRGLSPVWEDFMRHCRTLDFAEEPDYDKLRNMFVDALRDLRLSDDPMQHDWRRKGVHTDGMRSRRSSVTGEEHRAPTVSRRSFSSSSSSSSTSSRSPRRMRVHRDYR